MIPSQSNSSIKLLKSKEADNSNLIHLSSVRFSVRFQFVKQPCFAKDFSLNVCMSFCLNLLQSLLNQAQAESR